MGEAAGILLLVLAGLLLFMKNVNPNSGSAAEGLLAPWAVQGQTPAPNQVVSIFGAAIARAEGVNPSANNPGALALGDVGNGTLNSSGVSIFTTIEEGWQRLYTQLEKVLSGNDALWNGKAADMFGLPSATDLTIGQFSQIWTGGDNPTTWADSVAGSLGVTPETPVSQLGGK